MHRLIAYLEEYTFRKYCQNRICHNE